MSLEKNRDSQVDRQTAIHLPDKWKVSNIDLKKQKKGLIEPVLRPDGLLKTALKEMNERENHQKIGKKKLISQVRTEDHK